MIIWVRLCYTSPRKLKAAEQFFSIPLMIFLLSIPQNFKNLVFTVHRTNGKCPEATGKGSAGPDMVRGCRSAAGQGWLSRLGRATGAPAPCGRAAFSVASATLLFLLFPFSPPTFHRPQKPMCVKSNRGMWVG